jgi:hypothetical protein
MFAHAQLLHHWLEQRPSNKSDFDSNITEEVERVYYVGVEKLLM